MKNPNDPDPPDPLDIEDSDYYDPDADPDMEDGWVEKIDDEDVSDPETGIDPDDPRNN